MKLYSTNHKSEITSLETAILKGQAPDGGLYVPVDIPKLSKDTIKSFQSKEFNQIAFEIAKSFLQDEIPEERLYQIIQNTYDFPIPHHTIDDKISFLELFHGPTLAFKDFGARFMARLMGYYVKQQNKTKHRSLTILVATSGDTGSAVASAFYKVPNINVVILYPSKQVSPSQELQLTTWGENIIALEIDGTFDDCQKAVKLCFQDQVLTSKLNLTSANSINIARLIPQSFYYFYIQSQLQEEDLVFSVPSGNFGNLTAGLMAQRMGMPVKKIVAATNANRVVPDYLETGELIIKESVQTVSNAMDVGNPSNIVRIQELFKHDLDTLRSNLIAYAYEDDQTKATIKELFNKYNYIICPHTAVGYLAACDYQKENKDHVVVLATAHPAKFKKVVEGVLDRKIDIPPALQKIANREKRAFFVDKKYEEIKSTITGLLE